MDGLRIQIDFARVWRKYIVPFRVKAIPPVPATFPTTNISSPFYSPERSFFSFAPFSDGERGASERRVESILLKKE